MKKPKIALPWGTMSSCPCGSGRKFAACCRGVDGTPRVPKFNLARHENETGVNNDNCYLSGNYNCCKKITLEHPISRNILDSFSNLAIRGFSKSDGSVDVIVPAKSAGYRVLCKTHNSDINILDEHAGRIFRYLGLIIIQIRHVQKNPIEGWVYIDGPKLEAWSVKVIAAHQAIGNFTEFGSHVNYHVDWKKIRIAILTGEFEPGAGLYICAAQAANEVDGIQYNAVVSNGWLIGIRCVMRGFSFLTIFDFERVSAETIPENATYRGSIHQLFAQGGSALLFLAWNHRANLKTYSRGELRYAQTGSSSTAPFLPLDGPPEQDVRTKLRPPKEDELRAFAPQPNAPVRPALPPLKK
ncbi:SEC-C metal-binding domain-containing protein [Xanthobacter autotrophicus]|uniref:SEC-C metal-binding domain-containing protein n=1 Tax=Xanthobacter autotrophicus TaxID=280 RepID=UPI00372979EA